MIFRVFLITGLISLCLNTAASSQATQTTAAAASRVFTGIVVECSGTQRMQMDRVVSVIKQFTETMQPGDEAFVVRYVDPARTSVVQELTKEKSDINDAAEGLYVEAGQTSLFDALEYSAKYFAKNRADGSSPTLIVISSGEDKGEKSVDETLTLLKDQQIRVYAITVSDLKVSPKSLERLSRDTGGRSYVPRTTADLSNAVIDITKSMHGAAAAK